MASLSGQTIASSYEQLLHTDTDGGGNNNTLVTIKDGDNGTTFGLKLATNKVEVIPGSDDANAFEVSQADGTAVFTVNSSTPSATLAGTLTATKALSSDTQTTPETILTLGATYANTGTDGGAGSGSRIEFQIPDDETNPITGAAIAGIKEAADDSDASAGMAFYVSQNDTTLDEVVRIDHDGKVGIGTNTPGYQLDLRRNDTGTATSLGIRQLGTGDASMAFQTTTSPYGFCIGVDGSDSDAFKIATGNDDVGTNTKLTITTDGELILKGTSLPTDFGNERGHLVISSVDHGSNNNYAILSLQGHSNSNSVGTGGIYFYDHSNNVAIIQADRATSESSSNLLFYTNGGSGVAERMRIDSSGNLGIGATSFGPRLYSIVDNNEYSAYFTSDSSSGTSASLGVRADSSSGDRKLVAFFNGGTNIANITYNGSTATYGTGSDKRLKENIDDYSNGLSLLNKVEVKKFDWISGRKQDVGVIAQDLNNIIPNVIVEGDTKEDIEEIWQVDYPRLVPYLIQAVQELSAKVEALENA